MLHEWKTNTEYAINRIIKSRKRLKPTDRLMYTVAIKVIDTLKHTPEFRVAVKCKKKRINLVNV